jgi:hypothetical protein
MPWRIRDGAHAAAGAHLPHRQRRDRRDIRSAGERFAAFNAERGEFALVRTLPLENGSQVAVYERVVAPAGPWRQYQADGLDGLAPRQAVTRAVPVRGRPFS